VRRQLKKYVAEGSKYAHWIGLYLSFHLNWVLGPFVHCRLQNLQTSEVTFAHVITLPILRSILSSTWCYKGVKITRLLNFSNKIPFCFYLGHLGCSNSSDRYSVCGKRPLAIAAMNTELPPFKDGAHNFKSASTIDRVITPLSLELIIHNGV